MFVVYAHRGASEYYPENTLSSFRAGIEMGADGIETDVHVTADGEIIVFHDDSLKRLLDVDKRVEECTFSYLRSLRLKDFNGKVQQGLFLPTLEEYIDICKRYQKVAVLELKNPMQKQYITKIVNFIKSCDMLENTIFISFAGENLVELKREYPTAKAQFLFCDATEQNLQFMVDNGLDADIYYKSLTKEYADLLKSNGIKINCWTVNNLQDATALQSLGVDFITSNILE